MKKKCLILTITVMLIFGLVGCGDAKKYEEDVNYLFKVADFDWVNFPEDALDDLYELEFVTEEGDYLKEDFEEVFEIQVELNELREDLRVSDTQNHLDLMIEITGALEELEKWLDDFYEIAESAGVDEEVLETLEDEFIDFMDEYFTLMDFFNSDK